MSKARILIVEDEAITALDEEGTLEELGYEVVGIVDTGEEAIAKANELKPDLVLMDITLKTKMTGTEAAWEIREQFDIPVIFVTAKGNKAIYDAAHYGHVTGYIIKPFDITKLQANIEAALRGELSPEKDWVPPSERPSH
jgi:two-component system, response regulator PdtaR